MLFQEQKVRHHHVGSGHGGAGASQGGGVFRPFGGGMDADFKSGEVAGKAWGDAGGGTGGMGVEREDDEAVGSGPRLCLDRPDQPVIAHNGPSPHTKCLC